MSVDTRLRVALVALLAAAGCSGEDSGEDSGGPGEPPPALPAGQAFTLSGAVTYDFVPATYTAGTQTAALGFAASSVRHVRNAKVQVRQGTAGTVLAETVTSETGAYSIRFTPGARGALVVAALAESASPSIRVEDNTDGDAVWAVGRPITDASPTVNLHATHGWNGTGYVPTNRIAAPFAILDSMYTAARRFLDLPRSVPFPPLKVNWSPNNTSQWGVKAYGQIGTSHYDGSEIYILGMAGVDTDEFDSHVIVHEWGHYFEDELSRSDSPGGPHGPGDHLDPRLAFGEGYGNALAAMLLPESMYVDTSWAAYGGFGFDAETGSDTISGPFSEMSVLRALYDLYDGGASDDDTVALGLGPIYDTLVGPQKNTDALTTIASFIAGLKAHGDIDATAETAVDAVLAAHGIGAITDPWGTGDANLSPMYTSIAVGATRSATLDGRYEPNKQPQVRYFVVQPSVTSLRITTSSAHDVDVHIYRNGVLLGRGEGATGTENVVVATQPGANHVVVLTGWGQVNGTYTATVTVSLP